MLLSDKKKHALCAHFQQHFAVERLDASGSHAARFQLDEADRRREPAARAAAASRADEHQNLLENAIKYGDGKCISIDFSEEEDCRLITVRNSGCSLKQEELINLFDSFYRGSNVGSADGSGLGLYISRQLMQKMDGEVFAEIKEDDFCATVVVRKA